MTTAHPEWSDWEPVAEHRVTSGAPVCRINVASRDQSYEYGLWEVTPGRFTIHSEGPDEFVHIQSGQGWLHETDGDSMRLEPGTMFVLPKGFNGEWEIEEPLQKAYIRIFATA
ncbi:cupin domain-containing protein [Mycobacterium sp. SMC-4]|uniref:cupin domain-containing protein n=1 Tax=Mycobacterium sp. SMC-4 TaxID=2857059 RepID=UPI003D0946EA